MTTRTEFSAAPNYKPFARCEGGKVKLAAARGNEVVARVHRPGWGWADELETVRRLAEVARGRAARAWAREKAEILARHRS